MDVGIAVLGSGEDASTEGVLFVVFSGQRGVFELVPGGGCLEGSAASGDRAAPLVDIGCFDEPPSADAVGAELSLFDKGLGAATGNFEDPGSFVE